MSVALHLASEDLPWLPLGPGIEVRVLGTDAKNDRWTAIFRMHPSSTLPPHRHVGASEFVILEGRGHHPQSGSFEPGDYAYEPAGAVHSALRADGAIVLYMVSHGPGKFLGPSGAIRYVADAAYFARLRDAGRSALKSFFFLTLWRTVVRPRPIPAASPGTSADGAVIVSPRSLPWTRLLDGVDAKTLHTDAELGIWTRLLRIRPGGSLPSRDHRDTGELFILEGTGRHPTTGAFGPGSYIRESGGARHGAIEAHTSTVILISGRQATTLRDPSGAHLLAMNAGPSWTDRAQAAEATSSPAATSAN